MAIQFRKDNLYVTVKLHLVPVSIKYFVLLQSSELVLDTIHQLLVATLNQLDNEPFMNVEVALRFFYMMGEVLPDKVTLWSLH